MTREQSRVFGEAADAYELGRPDYPADAVAWLLDGVRGTVLDVGEGSGKLSRAVAALDFDVIAVDPDERMLARNATVDTRVGTAEAIPLPDRSVAGVTAGQAWHWFDQAAAAAEVGRVLMPRGRLGLVWNVYDLADEFSRSLVEVIDPGAALSPTDDAPAPVAGFSPFDEAVFSWRRAMTPAGVEALVRSRSPFLVAATTEQQRTLGAVRGLVRTFVGSQEPSVEIAYRTYCYRADAVG